MANPYRAVGSRLWYEFDRETVIGAGVLRHSETPPEVAQGFARYVENLNKLRKNGPRPGNT